MIAAIAVITEKKKNQWSQRSYGNHFPVIAATTIAEIEKILSQRSLSLRLLRSLESGFLMITMITSLRSLYFFFSVITVIIAIIWKPGLSYTSLLHKIRFNNYYKQEGCIMLFTYSRFNCQIEKGLLNFVSERINVIYRINNTWYNFQKNKLPFNISIREIFCQGGAVNHLPKKILQVAQIFTKESKRNEGHIATT